MKYFRLLLFFPLFTLVHQGQAQEDYSAYSRLDYYTSETAAEMVVEVPANRRGNRIHFDLVFEQQILVRTYPGLPGRPNTVPFPTERLHQGENEITVSFYENDQWMDSRKVPVVIREHQLGEVKTDRLTGALISDGLPVFPTILDPLGFSCNEDVLRDILADGFNTLRVKWEYERKNPRKRLRWLDLCAEVNLKVVYDLSGILLKDIPEDKKIEQLKAEILVVSKHPAVLAWLVPAAGRSHDQVRELYHSMKEVDPYHPVVLEMEGKKMERSWLDGLDIALAEWDLQGEGPDVTHDLPGDIVSKLGYEKPVWIGFELADPESRSLSTLAASLAMIEGVSGIMEKTKTGRVVWPSYLREIMAHRLAGNPVKASTMNVNVVSSGWAGRGGIALVACNVSGESMQAKIHAEGLEGDFPVEVIGQGKTIETTAGVISDRLEGYETRYYRLIQKEDVHFRDPRRKNNLVADPGFEEPDPVGDIRNCFAGHHCSSETRLTKEGGNSLSILLEDEHAPFTIEVPLRSSPGDSVVHFSLWARLKPSTANYYLDRGWFGNRTWRDTMPFPQLITLGFSDVGQATFELTSSWKKYELEMDLGGRNVEIVRPFIKLHYRGEYLIDDLILY